MQFTKQKNTAPHHNKLLSNICIQHFLLSFQQDFFKRVVLIKPQSFSSNDFSKIFKYYSLEFVNTENINVYKN